MRTTKLPEIVFAVVLLWTSAAGAASQFLAPSDYDPKVLLPPPPQDGSPAANAELQELQRIEATRTPGEFADAFKDFKDEKPDAFEAAVGGGFALSALPATSKLLADLVVEEKAAAKAAKDYFQRARPWIVDPSLKTCASDDPPRTSYPSGHATFGYATAVMLAALMPERASNIMIRARAYAENRLVCSMHFRSDIVAGEALGTAVAVELIHNPQFKPEFDAAKAELKAAHLTN